MSGPGVFPQRQRGAILLACICIMLLLIMLAVSAARSAMHAEKAARGERDRQFAFQAAEAALVDAERDIEAVRAPDSARARMFAPGAHGGFVANCGRGGENQGLCRLAAPGQVPAWQRANLAARVGANAASYGSFSGNAMPTGQGTLPARAPRYVIEQLPYVRAGESAGTPGANFYRITAIGFGANEATRVVLQSYYLKAAPAGEAP